MWSGQLFDMYLVEHIVTVAVSVEGGVFSVLFCHLQLSISKNCKECFMFQGDVSVFLFFGLGAHLSAARFKIGFAGVTDHQWEQCHI